mmetsp:Transcript_22147/g.48173  ORF Transcript_22147/g.48173 Transcript_22147/m.48173 type:complete len:81 (-) Transcript_22147:1210-1452(-)
MRLPIMAASIFIFFHHDQFSNSGRIILFHGFTTHAFVPNQFCHWVFILISLVDNLFVVLVASISKGTPLEMAHHFQWKKK